MVFKLAPRHLLPGIEWLPLRSPTLPPAQSTNAWLLGGDQRLLVDPGCTDIALTRRLVGWLQTQRDHGAFRLVAVVLTHHHLDHVGAASEVCAALSVPLWAHERTAALLPRLHVDRYLVEGDDLELVGHHAQTWRVLHTPGHAPGHLCLWEPSMRALVLGDMIAGEGTILIASKDGGDMAAYLTQLDRLAQFDALVGLPGHGEAIERPGLRLAELRQHRRHREDKLLDVLRGQTRPVRDTDLLVQVYDDTPKRAWPLALHSLHAHLDKLVQEGRVTQVDSGRYRLA